MPSPDRRSPGPQTLRVLAGRRPRILLLEIKLRRSSLSLCDPQTELNRTQCAISRCDGRALQVVL